MDDVRLLHLLDILQNLQDIDPAHFERALDKIEEVI